MNDDTLTNEEEARFAELFAPADRLTLTHDWQRVLRDNIAAERAAQGMPAAPAESGADVIDFGAAKEQRAARTRGLGLAMAAAVILLVGVFGVISFNNRLVSSEDLENIPVLDADLEVDTPSFRSLDLPVGTLTVVQAGSGTLLAQTLTDDGRASVIHLSDDGDRWVESVTLPVINPIFDLNTDLWVIYGEDGESADAGRFDELLSTGLVLFQSRDFGDTWERVEVDTASDETIEEGATLRPEVVSLAVIDETILASYHLVVDVDLTDVTINAGLAEPGDEVIIVNTTQRFVAPFVFGESSFDLIEDAEETLGMGRNPYESLVYGASLNDAVLLRSDEDGRMSRVDYPDDGFHETAMILSNDDMFVYIAFGGTSSLSLFESPDGLTWTEVELEDLTSSIEQITDDWSIHVNPLDELRQSTDGGLSLPRVPTPDLRTTAVNAFPTDFGAAVTWQEQGGAPSISIAGSFVEKDGIRIEFFDDGTSTVTDETGAVLSDRQPFLYREGSRVVPDSQGFVHVFDEQNQKITTFSDDELFVGQTATGHFFENPPDMYVSWSTDGEEWNFADLAPIGPGLWDFASVDEGLVGIRTIGPEAAAVLVEWPEAVSASS